MGDDNAGDHAWNNDPWSISEVPVVDLWKDVAWRPIMSGIWVSNDYNNRNIKP